MKRFLSSEQNVNSPPPPPTTTTTLNSNEDTPATTTSTTTSTTPPTNTTHTETIPEVQQPLHPVEPTLLDQSEQILEQASQTTPDAVVSSASEVLSHLAPQIGDFSALGLCNYTPVGALEAMFEYIHVYSGLPWWGTIALATVLVRTALLPLMIKIQRNNAILMNINPDVTRLMNNIKTAQASGDTLATQKYSMEVQNLFKKNKCHPMKSLGLPFMQMPVMISFFMAIRGMAEIPVPGLENQGLFWFQNLSQQDPYYILPALSAASMLAVLETGADAGAVNPQGASMKKFFRGMALLTVPFTYWMPSGVFVYWITSNIYSMGQMIALKNPAIRSALNIPKLALKPKEALGKPKSFMDNFKEQTKLYEKKEKDRALRERQQAAAAARRAAKRRF
ncbi:60Kd inner membrane protein-domain-containing protein [Mycotypha africana]|uniref:60Kd inner membrane protein-domain-containing protein n=1 Tax=Mycotypha africana TaxID=64632 RepID=UPI002300A331|nr:60Kd inner membrane protein-domain-containing protein [Mycotypha africana]KAI8987691.1 60Kd inner membrane protein-domain-containing protein [Mycotypha africana]